MNKSDYHHIGTLAKSHGYKGGYTLVSDTYLSDELEDKESVFIEVDGLLVPFFIHSIQITTDSSAIISFDDITDIETGKEFLGCKVFASLTISKDEAIDPSLEMLVGYLVKDKTLGVIGKIDSIIEYSYNSLFQIMKGDDEILIPISEEIILKLNHKKREILIDAPEGLLELNN